MFTTASLARQISDTIGRNVPTWRVRRVFESGQLPDNLPRAGVARILSEDVAAAVLDTLEAGDYLTAEEAQQVRDFLAQASDPLASHSIVCTRG